MGRVAVQSNARRSYNAEVIQTAARLWPGKHTLGSRMTVVRWKGWRDEKRRKKEDRGFKQSAAPQFVVCGWFLPLALRG